MSAKVKVVRIPVRTLVPGKHPSLLIRCWVWWTGVPWPPFHFLRFVIAPVSTAIDLAAVAVAGLVAAESGEVQPAS